MRRFLLETLFSSLWIHISQKNNITSYEKKVLNHRLLENMENENAQPLTRKQRRTVKRQEKLQIREIQRKNGLKHRILLWGGLCVGLLLLVLGLIALHRQPNGQPSPVSNEEILSVQEGEWTQGNPEAMVTLVEYSDFQCPACKNYAPILQKLRTEFPDDLRMVYRHFPLNSIHRNAKMAAQAAEAAGTQGTFWEMHDKIFDGQGVWKDQWNPEDTFIQYAKELNLNGDQFKDDLEAKAIVQAVEADIEVGNRLFINATPTFFLNKKQLQNPPSYEDFVRLIHAEIEFLKTSQPVSNEGNTATQNQQTIHESCPNGWGEPGSNKCIRGEITVRIDGKYSSEEVIQRIETAGLRVSTEDKERIIQNGKNLDPMINAGKYFFQLKVPTGTEKEAIEEINAIGPDFEAWYSSSAKL